MIANAYSSRHLSQNLLESSVTPQWCFYEAWEGQVFSRTGASYSIIVAVSSLMAVVLHPCE